MNTPGLFVSFEGIDGSGKSTMTRFLCDVLREYDIPVICTREPGGTTLANAIRAVVLQHEAQEVLLPKSELLLMYASRMQHIHGCIQPALRQGMWVVSDRFEDASFAYQGGGRGIAMKDIAFLSRFVCHSIQPDCTFLLDAPVSVCMQRLSHRIGMDRIELESDDFFERVRSVYRQRARAEPNRFCIIDTDTTREEAERSILQCIQILINRYRVRHQK